MMLRSFHPIGQGAFYSEEFEDFTVVYDCGSDNGISLLRKEINSVFEKGRKIDALFISHFDSDHVNGLNFLLTHCNIKNIFLPDINNTEKIQLLIHHSITGNLKPFLKNLIINPENAIKKISNSTNIIYVLPVDKKDENSNDRKLILEEYSQDIPHVMSGVNITSQSIKSWVYVPFNFQSSDRSEILTNELNIRGIQLKNIKDFETCWADGDMKKLLYAAYKAMPGNFNTNSMTLYSGPDGTENEFEMVAISPRPLLVPYYQHYISTFKVGCLYLGDYEAKGTQKWDELYFNYQPFWNNIGVVQIPHHGSQHNYNNQLNKNQAMISVISCGITNRHRHPHSSTLRNIVMNGGTPIIVNESVGTRAQFHVANAIYGVSPKDIPLCPRRIRYRI